MKNELHTYSAMLNITNVSEAGGRDLAATAAYPMGLGLKARIILLLA